MSKKEGSLGDPNQQGDVVKTTWKEIRGEVESELGTGFIEATFGALGAIITTIPDLALTGTESVSIFFVRRRIRKWKREVAAALALPTPSSPSSYGDSVLGKLRRRGDDFGRNVKRKEWAHLAKHAARKRVISATAGAVGTAILAGRTSIELFNPGPNGFVVNTINSGLSLINSGVSSGYLQHNPLAINSAIFTGVFALSHIANYGLQKLKEKYYVTRYTKVG